MKLTKAILRERKIFNSCEVCSRGGGAVWLSYHARDVRGVSPAKWMVVGVGGLKTDPSGHWGDYGSKSFCGTLRSDALDKAKAWATEKYGIATWERDPFGGWQDNRVMEALRNHLTPAAECEKE